jgi:Mn-containing catalase
MNSSDAFAAGLAEPDGGHEECARKLKALLTGPQGKLSMAMQYMSQVSNPDLPETFRETLLLAGNEELDHVGLLANMISRLRKGSPGKAVNLPVLSETAGVTGAFMRSESASGNLLADFRRNLEAETQSREHVLKLLPEVKDEAAQELLHYIASRDACHQNIWFDAIAELQKLQKAALPTPSVLPTPMWTGFGQLLAGLLNPFRGYLRRA